ncbi:MAG: undecaprenyl-diphosphate phosphatase [Alphaproteobacteria bacterium]|nr:undecaprenyl-diphosphate phosphatase [Alphaproteobacteria bacterium]
MDELIKIIILGIVQGIAEFLPISSNAHLIMVEQLLDYHNHNEILNLVFHLGSLLAIIIYFFSELLGLLKKPKMIFNIIVATIPVIIVGYFVHKFHLLNYEYFSIKIIAVTLIIFGIILFISDKINHSKTLYEDLNIKSSLVIGFFQIISLIPGVSRSGITLTAGRFLGYSRFEAAKFSFFLSIPTTAGACFLGVLDLIKTNNSDLNYIAVVAFITSFFSSYLTIKFFLSFISKFNLNIFIYYRVTLGVFILLFL